MKVRCDTCPFNPEGSHEVRLKVMERVLNVGSQTCHTSGLKYGRPDTHLCRGARDFQLQIFYRNGFLEAPTDEAWAKKCKELNINQDMR